MADPDSSSVTDTADSTGDDENADSTGDAEKTRAEIAAEFIDDVVYYWEGVDYASAENPTGYTDSDYDGEIDSNDAVNFVETLMSMGYDVPETTINGLYENYYTEAGYDSLREDSCDRVDFTYAEASTVTADDLRNFDWSGLEEGDLIFTDWDKDGTWDNAAVYLGYYGGYSNAAFLASDFYDKCVIVDLDDDNSVLNQDITYGNSDVKKPVFDAYPEF